jgi:iron complex transport system substrate-binding protein
MLERVSSRRSARKFWPLYVVVSTLFLAGPIGCRRQPAAKNSAPVRRVVTLSPSLTEIVFALQAGDRVVGVSDYCDYPPEAKQRPRVGNFLSPSVERILELRPDLVLLDGVQRDIAAVLQQAGAQALTVPLQDLSQVRAALGTVGEALGDRQAEAQKLLAQLDGEIAEVKRQTQGLPPRRALFVVDRQIGGLRGLVVAGPGSYLDELLRLSGGVNVFSDLSARYAKVAVEAIEERRPEVIFDAVHTEKAQLSSLAHDWEQLSAVPAVAQHRVHVLGDVQFVTPGPRLGRALRRMASLLHDGLPPPPPPPSDSSLGSGR